jgi:hypothetical protein
VRFAQRYRYLFRNTGILVYTYDADHAILLVLETEEQRDNIFAFL